MAKGSKSPRNEIAINACTRHLEISAHTYNLKDFAKMKRSESRKSSHRWLKKALFFVSRRLDSRLKPERVKVMWLKVMRENTVLNDVDSGE